MRYTKGEWLFDPNESEFSDKHYVFCPAGKTICSIFGLHNDPEDEANGNALLIAASPDLLRLIKQVLPDNMGGYPDLFHPDQGWENWEKEVLQVIAKIEGE